MMVTCGRRSRIVTWTDWGAQGLGSVPLCVRRGLGDPQPSAWKPLGQFLVATTRNGKQGPKSHCSFSLLVPSSQQAGSGVQDSGFRGGLRGSREPASSSATGQSRRRKPRAYLRAPVNTITTRGPEACGTRAQPGYRAHFWPLLPSLPLYAKHKLPL